MGITFKNNLIPIKILLFDCYFTPSGALSMPQCLMWVTVGIKLKFAVGEFII